MSNHTRKPSAGLGPYVPLCLTGIFVLATGLFVATLGKPAMSQAIAGYFAVLVTILLAAVAWGYARTSQETLGATRDMLALIRAEFEANRPTVSVDVVKAGLNVSEPQPDADPQIATVLVHLRAAFTNSSKSSPTTVTAKAAFLDAAGQECGTVREVTFFRQPRPHQLTLPPGDIVESTLLISGDLGSASVPEKLDLELRFFHPFEGQLAPIKVQCAKLGTPAVANS
jgi:hypothetical protein